MYRVRRRGSGGSIRTYEGGLHLVAMNVTCIRVVEGKAGDESGSLLVVRLRQRRITYVQQELEAMRRAGKFVVLSVGCSVSGKGGRRKDRGAIPMPPRHAPLHVRVEVYGARPAHTNKRTYFDVHEAEGARGPDETAG